MYIKAKEPSRPIVASELGKEARGNSAGREVGVGKSSQKRANIDWMIEELKDHRSFIGKWIGVFGEKTAQREMIEVVKKYFSKIGVKIPEDILEVLNETRYITEEQSEELKRLAAREDYGPFMNKDIVDTVMKISDTIGLASVNASFRKLLDDPKERLRVVLTGKDLLDPKNEKVQFARENNLKLSIKLDKYDSIPMLAFMRNRDNIGLLNNLEAIHLPVIQAEDNNYVHDLLNLMTSQCPNLVSFSCQAIYQNLTLPLLVNLKFFSCGYIADNITLTFPKGFPTLQHVVLGGTQSLSQSQIQKRETQ